MTAFALTPEQEELRKLAAEVARDVYAPLAAELDAERRPLPESEVKRLADLGFLGLAIPEEYGGQGGTLLDALIVVEELAKECRPAAFEVFEHNTGPIRVLEFFGTEEQKQTYLRGSAVGEITMAVGISEPDAGSAATDMKTRAVLDGDEYVINGNKVFTSQANDSDYIWLACRTNPEAPKHKGISIVAVPTSTPGFSWTIIRTVGRTTTCATYYDSVRVPVGNRIGPENEGWRMITTQLNHERVGLAAMGGPAYRLWDEVLAWTRATPAGDGSDRRMIDLEWVQMDLARSHARLAAMRLLNWRMACALEAGDITAADSSAVKVYGTECLIDVFRSLLGVLGPVGYLRAGSPGAALRGQIELMARSAQINTFGGGVNDVQREIVAAAGLGMARRARDAQ